MERELFGHRLKKRAYTGKVPGKPYNNMGSSYGDTEDNPPGYEGKEHVKYKNPGYTRHNIRYPDDEPHMKSDVDRDEMHEAEDDYHMGVPDQTEYDLPKKIKRARMKMDAPDQEDPDSLRGNIVHNVPYNGELDTTGEEEMGPNMMQSDSKERRKKMIAAITKRKMSKK